MGFECDEVTPECPVEMSLYGDYFTLAATATYAGIFGACLISQFYLSWRSKLWSYGSWLIVGTLCEFVGYVARSIMTENPWNFNAFLAQNLGLVLGPTFVAAAISVTFKYLVLWYGPEQSVIKPKLYPWVFVGSDMVSILVQSAGGGMASAGGDMSTLGNNLLLAGVSFQVVNMTFCGGLIVIYMWRMRRNPVPCARAPPCTRGVPGEVIRNGRRVKALCWALFISYMTILIRCIYR